ncbi:MAG TPA: pilus assembly protein PilP, partial [Myxococcota bacterium]|nr:pilus assembly protein PilP [Myxococcota bacterium]
AMKTIARFAVLAGALALLGCEDQGNTATVADFEKNRAAAQARGAEAAAQQAPQRGPAAAAKAPNDERTRYGTTATGYRYDPTGKRDPFRSFVRDKLREDIADIASPLEEFELGQLTVSGVVWQADRRRALVLDPAGQAYVVKTGDRIGKNDGVVTEIGDSSLVVLESYVDFHGDKTEKEIEMRIRQSTGG